MPAKKKKFNLNDYLQKHATGILIIFLCILIICPSVAGLVYYSNSKSQIAELERTVYALALDVSPGPSRLSGDALNADNGTVTVVLDNSFVTIIGDTGPMQPWLGEGVVVVLEITQDVRVGDVVFYERGGYRVLQRIVGEQGGQWIVKSDRELEALLIDKAAVLGRLAAVFY